MRAILLDNGKAASVHPCEGENRLRNLIGRQPPRQFFFAPPASKHAGEAWNLLDPISIVPGQKLLE
jgi:hypothetical protein